YKASATEVDERLKEMKAELKKIGRDFDKVLADLKVPEKELRIHVAADLRWFKYANGLATDKALEELFNGNKDMFDGSEVKAIHILIAPRSKIPQDHKAAVKQLRSIRTAIEKEVTAAVARLNPIMAKRDRDREVARLWSETFSKYAREKSE